MIELVVAMALLTAAVLPIAYSFASEKRLAMACYKRAVAMEIVDGEMEALVSGAWRAFAPGTHSYPVSAAAAGNLGPGDFLLTVQTNVLRLEWRPAGKHQGGVVMREVKVE